MDLKIQTRSGGGDQITPIRLTSDTGTVVDRSIGTVGQLGATFGVEPLTAVPTPDVLPGLHTSSFGQVSVDLLLFIRISIVVGVVVVLSAWGDSSSPLDLGRYGLGDAFVAHTGDTLLLGHPLRTPVPDPAEDRSILSLDLVPEG